MANILPQESLAILAKLGILVNRAVAAPREVLRVE